MDNIFEIVERQIANMCGGMVTLQNILEAIENEKPKKKVVFSDGTIPGSYDSYRGYYEYISLSPDGKKCTVKDLLEMTRGAVDATFEGYKGGEYRMKADGRVWCSEWGEASGMGITAIKVEKYRVILELSQIDQVW